MQNFEKLAALGALGVGGGSFAAWLGLVFITRPVSTGGIDGTSHFAVAVSALVVLGLVGGAHVLLGQQLRRGPDSIRG